MDSQWISEASNETFDIEVIDGSSDQLVLVDFWATWCAPCKTLGPILESVVKGRAGTVRLVKVDIDTSPELAARYQVKGVPVVKAFYGGELRGELVGVRDKKTIEAFVDQMRPSSGVIALETAGQLLSSGEAEEARSTLGPALEDAETRPRGLLLQASAWFAQGERDKAIASLELVPEATDEREAARGLILRFELIGQSRSADEPTLRAAVDEAPNDVEARWSLAGLLLAAGRHEQALAELLEILRRDRGFRDDGARRAILSVLEEIGVNSELAYDTRTMMQAYM